MNAIQLMVSTCLSGTQSAWHKKSYLMTCKEKVNEIAEGSAIFQLGGPANLFKLIIAESK